jgi:hypothetical protein
MPAYCNLEAILLNARRAKAGETMLVNGHLPGKEFIDSERVAAAGFLQRQKASADRGHDLRLAPDDPAFRCRRRQIGDGQRASIWPDDIFRAMTIWFCHIQNSRIKLTLQFENIGAVF